MTGGVNRSFTGLWWNIGTGWQKGYIEMIERDIELSKLLFSLADSHPELEAVTQNLSIATLRYIPPGVDRSDDHQLIYLNDLNKMLLDKLQIGGEVFLSNAIVQEKYCLRACIVNFRTSEKDIKETIDIIVRQGRKMYDGSKQ